MEQKKPFPLTEDMLRENENLLSLIKEEQRYKQNARMRALEAAQTETGRHGGDTLTEAKKYYDWLMEIASKLTAPDKEAATP